MMGEGGMQEIIIARPIRTARILSFESFVRRNPQAREQAVESPFTRAAQDKALSATQISHRRMMLGFLRATKATGI